jgi:GNAT superfamily N-acetyltransferase
MNSVIIRKGTLGDIPNIKECLVASWVEHARKEPELLDEERMRQSDIEGYYKKCFDNPDKCFVFVAEVGGKFAGFQRADIQEIPPFFKHNKILYLDDAYTIPEFRRKGVATILIREAEKTARKLGIKRIQSRVYTFNKPARELLMKLGYRSPHATWDKVLK